jgi:mycothiol maleylpyruvate isomerase-like protein
MRNREKGTAVDYVGHFEREAAAFEAAARRAAGPRAAPDVPSCPEWVVTDLVLHLGMVHRLVARLVSERIPGAHAAGRGPGTACDLALFLWQRPVTGLLDVRGDSSLLERYFVLVPPL